MPEVQGVATEVRVELETRESPWRLGPGGRAVDAWTYNGNVPGPTIEAPQGATLIARLTNRLPEPTTIHWHGLRLPAPMDGTESVQRPVRPGETFEYRFALPDAGTFWYHPHSNETVQLERGLYGALVVQGPNEPVVDRERVLIFDDVRLSLRGGIARPGGWLERHNGREGKVRLLNGRVDPVLEMAAGQLERWRLVNAASARYVRFNLEGRPFCVIGADGGLVEAAVDATEVLLVPGERYDLLLGPFDEGEEFSIVSLPFNRGTGRKRVEPFGSVHVGSAAPSIAEVPGRLRVIEPLAGADAIPTREVRLGGRRSWSRGVDFLINGEMHHHERPVRVGELQIWDVVNETVIHHPFHLHGFFFQVLEVNGEAPAFRSWKDTLSVPPRGRARIAWLPDNRPGRWMYHCHILEHHAAGMMAHFEVVQ